MTDKLDHSAASDDDQGTRIAREPTGSGAEAAEGIHGEPEHRETRREPSDRSSLTGREDKRDEQRSGSEPFESSSHEHRSGYGGDGGEPKPPNDIPHSRR